MSVLSSPVRRVLGDKDPNAPLQILSPNKTKVGTQDGSPIHNRSDLKRPASPTSYHITSPRAGQKRRLEEISLQPPSDPQSSPASLLQSSSQKTDMLNDSISQTSSSPQRTDPGKRSTPKPIWNSSFQASQEESQKFEQQFVIHDEMSQRALDSMVDRLGSVLNTLLTQNFSMRLQCLTTRRNRPNLNQPWPPKPHSSV